MALLPSLAHGGAVGGPASAPGVAARPVTARACGVKRRLLGWRPVRTAARSAKGPTLLPVLPQLLTRAAVRATSIFYELSRGGMELPPGPILVVANHPNSWMDALVVFCTSGRKVRPLARAPLFDKPGVGHVLRGLGGLPVYRPEDAPHLVGRNAATFDAAAGALRRGEAVLIFPEGRSHSESGLAPLKTGAARIALRAEAASDWRLGLRIVPIGLAYKRKTAFRGRAAALVGEPLSVAPWQEAYRRDNVAAAQALTATIATALERVTLRLSDTVDAELLVAAEALYAVERGLAPRRDGELAAHLPRLKLFEGGVHWLRAHDPERLERLEAAVGSYRSRLARLGIAVGELPERHPAHKTLRSIGTQALIAGLELPLACLGIAAWYLPYASPRPVLLFYEPVYEARATFKLVTGMLAFPLAYAAWLVLAWRLGGGPVAGAAAVILPLAGLSTLHWRRHWDEFVQDLRFLRRALRRHGLAAQLRSRREAIAAEIDRVAADWELQAGEGREEGPAPGLAPRREGSPDGPATPP